MRTIPRTEHPRPDFRRERWLNLNGAWEFEFDPNDAGMTDGWHTGTRTFSQEIIVPFPWESTLSDIARPDVEGIAWYRRTFAIPEAWKGQRVLLKFGAVDWEARVWVNGSFVGIHRGGYSAFEFNITDHVREGPNVLVVRVFDDTRPEYPTGKQTNWYTHTSGIWQTVYLEATGNARITRLHVSPDVANEQALVDLSIVGEPGEYGLELSFLRRDLPDVRRILLHNGNETTVRVAIPIPDPELWSPEHPALYEMRAALIRAQTNVDVVHTYFGMREVRRGCYGDKPYEYIFLNGTPIYLLGALHQSFHPDGIYTYPSDSALREDIERAKQEYGFNFLRIHIKVDEPRLYYWADRLGLLIMYDLPNYSNDNAAARAYWEQTLRDAIERDYNHPSIFAWVLFNETWGIGHGDYDEETQRWVEQMFRLTKSLDPTRLVEENSPCRYDHVVTDINSWHFYIDDVERARAHIEEVVEKTFPGSPFNYVDGRTQNAEPLINSEFGNVSAGGGDRDISWGFKYLTNELRRHDKICGYVYTELTDIEWEHNGVMNYDRTRKEFGYSAHVPGFSILNLNAPDYLVLDSPPCPEKRPGETIHVPVFISHWSQREADGLMLAWRLSGVDAYGETNEYARGERPAEWRPYTVHPLGEITVTLPEETCLATLSVWLTDARGKRLAANYMNLLVAGAVPVAERLDGGVVLARFSPEAYASAEWTGRTFPEVAGKAAGCGSGHFEYRLALPADIAPTQIERLEVVFEASAKADTEKLDWPARRKEQDYPQTDMRKHPTDVRLIVNDAARAELHFADDPADMRGVLSHLAGVHHGAHGELTRVAFPMSDPLREAIDTEDCLRIRFEVPQSAANVGGFALYGARTGRYPLDPYVLFHLHDDVLPVGWRSDEALTRDALPKETAEEPA